MFIRTEPLNRDKIQYPLSLCPPDITAELIFMFAIKRLDYSVFVPTPGLSLNSDLKEHVAWAFQHIYSHDYPNGSPRLKHGIQHVTRVATYVPVLINLYRKYGDPEALLLAGGQTIKLLQIAALFHDSARENEGIDYWDKESGVILFLYLTRVLGVNAELAAKVAEATAGKDADTKTAVDRLIETPSLDKILRYTYNPSSNNNKKTLLSEIIHDADCLDIIRARAHFITEYLDLYQFYLQNKNEQLLEEIAQLRCEVRSLIEIQGDSYSVPQQQTKQYYNNAKAYQRTLVDIRKNRRKHRILYALREVLLPPLSLSTLTLVDRTPYDKSAGLTTANMNAALREGRVFVRGQGSPSAIALNGKETLSELELRKTFRHPDVKSLTGKINLVKYGNPYRSISMIGYGAGVFNSAGFMIIDPEIPRISKVNAHDCDSGRGKKKEIRGFFALNPSPSVRAIQHELDQLRMKLKLGGELSKRKSYQLYNHTEILYDITSFQAIYFSRDPNLHNNIVGLGIYPIHHHSPMLQAIYLRKLYERYYEETKRAFILTWGEENGVTRFTQRFGCSGTLPVFQYSGIHNTLFKVEESALSDANIIKMWMEMSSDYMQIHGQVNSASYLHELSLDQILIKSMYGDEYHKWALKSGSADKSYSSTLRNQVRESLEKTKTCLMNNAEISHRVKIISGEMIPLAHKELAHLYRKAEIIDLLNDVDLKAELNNVDDNDYSLFLTYEENYFTDDRSNSAMAGIYAKARALGESSAANHIQNIAFNIINKESRKTRGCVTRTSSVEMIHVMKFILAYDLKRKFKNSMIDPLIDYYTICQNWIDAELPGYGAMVVALYHLKLINKERHDEIGERFREYLLQDVNAISVNDLYGIKQEIIEMSILNDFMELLELIEKKIRSISVTL